MFDIDDKALVELIASKKNIKKSIDLSVIITAHKEGLLAHKTMLSVMLGLKEVILQGYSTEIIVHIDNGDERTKKYFKRYKGIKNFSIYENNFADIGLSRNYAAKKAKGKYIAFVDADDLYSANYFMQAVRMLEESKEEIVVHAEAILLFGIEKDNILSIEHDSNPGDSDALQLIGANKWGSEIVAKKKTLNKCQYRKTEKGYGYEDYMLNVELLNMGVAHRIAKNTVRFYRRTENSLLMSENSKNTTIPYMDFFNFKKITEKPLNNYTGANDIVSARKTERIKNNKIYRKIRDNSFLNYFITPLAHQIVKKQLKTQATIPQFVIEEWKNINKIELQLYPHAEYLKRVFFYRAEDKTNIGVAYYNIMKQVTKKPDYVLIVPWLIRGGGDKVVLNYIEALHEIHKDWHFVVIATNPDICSTWAKKLPKCVDFVEFGDHIKILNYPEWYRLMTAIITQLNCKRLHIINSDFGYRWAMKHKELIKENYKLNVTLFADEYIPGTDQRGIFGYDDPYLTSIIDVTRMVSTDNRRMVDRMMSVDGFMEKEKFKVHYQPVIDTEMRPAKDRMVEEDKLHILWAGRVVPVKMPELLVKIGKKLDPKKYVIDVFGEIGEGLKSNMFNETKTIRYHGGFDGFNSLPIDKSDILLYISRSDGIPNIILEATMAGLPIIASNDGGVGEVIKDGETGILVEDMLNPDAYIEKIKNINNIKELKKYVDNAQKLIKTRHSWKMFLDNVKKDLVDYEEKK